jgi:hypothetical protein
MNKRKSGAGIDLKPILIIIGLILVPLTIFIIYRISISDKRIVPISILAIIIGVIAENKRLTPKWSTVLYLVVFSFVLSFFCFIPGIIPGKRDANYVFENQIEFWPYSFLFFFVIFSVAFNKEKLIPKLSEVITLILSVVIIYWIIDHGFYTTTSIVLKILMIIGFLIAVFSFVNAFTNIKLTNSIRLTLSIWSSIIMILLAIDNIYSVYHNGQVEDTISLSNKVFLVLQFFLIGVSGIYIVQNILMILMFLPSNGGLFSNEYRKDLKILIKDHLNRYSDHQSSISFSLICLILSGAFFTINYRLNIIPRNTAIWIIFFVSNYIIYFYENVKNKNYR